MPSSLLEELAVWARGGSPGSELLENVLPELAERLLRKREAEVWAVWPGGEMDCQELVSSFLERHLDSELASGAFGKAKTDDQARGYLYYALANHLEDHVRKRSPKRRMFRRLKEALEKRIRDDVILEGKGAPAFVRWHGDKHHPDFPEAVQVGDRFSSSDLAGAAAALLSRAGRPYLLRDLVNMLADHYTVPATDAWVFDIQARRADRPDRTPIMDVLEAVENFRDLLDERDRKILDLWFKGLSITDIAEEIRRTKSTVHHTIHKRIGAALAEAIDLVAQGTATRRLFVSLLAQEEHDPQD